MISVALARKSVAFLLGAAIGQAAFLVTSLILVKNNSTYVAEISTGYGVAMLFTILVDWGGSITQRQLASKPNLSHLIVYITARAPLGALIVGGIILLNHLGLPSTGASQFLLGSSLGIFLFILNPSGFLDIADPKALHAYTQGLPAVGTCSAFAHGEKPLTCGVMFSVGCVVVLALQLWRMNACTSKTTNPPSEEVVKFTALSVLHQGCYVMLSNIPGQLISRIIPAHFLSDGNANFAATYNIIKQSQNILNQTVSMFRRAEYPYAVQRLGLSRTSPFLIINSQNFSLTAGVLLGIAGTGLFLVISKHAGIPTSLVWLSFLQSLLWILTSSIFFYFQLRGRNGIQAIYGLIFSSIFLISFYFYGTSNITEALLIEMISSALAVTTATSLKKFGK